MDASKSIEDLYETDWKLLVDCLFEFIQNLQRKIGSCTRQQWGLLSTFSSLFYYWIICHILSVCVSLFNFGPNCVVALQLRLGI
jgi:hypothetical protein